MLLASVEHDIDSVVHDQVTEAVAEGQADGNCEVSLAAPGDPDWLPRLYRWLICSIAMVNCDIEMKS